MSCFDLVPVRLAIGTTFVAEYRLPGFFLSGLWSNSADIAPVVAIPMLIVAILHVAFLILPLFSTPFSAFRSPSAWFYTYFRGFLRNYWLGTLGLAVGGIVTTGLSGFSVWLLFLHAWFEGWLFSLRVATYLRIEHSVLPILIPPVVFIGLALTLMMASDSPIDKAIITLIPAFVSDIGNIVFSSLLVHRARQEAEAVDASHGDPSHGDPSQSRGYGMTIPDHVYELVFVLMHFLIFYPQLGLACVLSPFALSIILLVLFTLNATLLLIVNRQPKPIVQEQHKNPDAFVAVV